MLCYVMLCYVSPSCWCVLVMVKQCIRWFSSWCWWVYTLRSGILLCKAKSSILKQPFGMTSIFVFNSAQVVYPTDHVFYFFQIFYIFTNIFNQHFYETRSNPNKLFVYLMDDWMFSQHWATHADGIGPVLGRQSVLQVCPPVSWLWDTN